MMLVMSSTGYILAFCSDNCPTLLDIYVMQKYFGGPWFIKVFKLNIVLSILVSGKNEASDILSACITLTLLRQTWCIFAMYFCVLALFIYEKLLLFWKMFL